MADERTRGVQLSDKQLVFVFMTATVAAVVVFLFGVLVGRGVQHARGPLTDGSAMAANQVVSDATVADAPVADGVPQPESAAGAGAGDTYAYSELLGKTPPAGQPKGGVKPGEPARRDPPPVSPAPPEVPADAVAAPARPSAAAPYTVQVAAVTQRGEADAIVKQLKAKGYDAFVLAPESGDRVATFRVRIGSFKDRRSADMLAQRLLRGEKRFKPWVTR